ncbi:hypothetical protein CHS0354_000438 [Potamilus streckersoni]|uniref:Segregation/condensation protein A n=1 Tax=Potamilus streckersoni TaxID=2493646 RepID=A0AAE0T7M8_9BIVA|nr:hypothetical protein CHS0354_000438 [Potamilus streckersoni]
MYRIRLEEFEGPLDLLLFFIKRDEINVYNIPISKITEEFLAYLTAMKELDLEIAAEFIYMASMLISIKAKMLLPSTEVDASEIEDYDPRTELVERLLEYKQMKEASFQMRFQEEERRHLFERRQFDTLPTVDIVERVFERNRKVKKKNDTYCEKNSCDSRRTM